MNKIRARFIKITQVTLTLFIILLYFCQSIVLWTLTKNTVVIYFTIGLSVFNIAVMFCVFFLYIRLSNRYIAESESARKVAEQASKAKSEFLANMSHDIRTPMNAIEGMTAIAAAHMDDRETLDNCIKKIGAASHHLLGLINNVLDMSKIESGKLLLNMDNASLREIIESIVSIVQPQMKLKSQSFDVCIHNILCEDVICDRTRLNQVILNFLSNAIKFTPEGGRIELGLSQKPSPEGEPYVRTTLYVKDTGIGMSEEFKKKVFDTFSREDTDFVRRVQGTGLGMSITKYIVDAMGGTIEIDSTVGKGSVFTVTLDLLRSVEKEEDMSLPQMNILVVDDDRQLCETVKQSLEELGVSADVVLDGEDALVKVEERHKVSEDYDVILLDWRLPGLSGIETARKIHKLIGDAVPLILISAYDWTDIEETAKQAGVNGFISKPLFKSTLYYGIRKYTVPERERSKDGEDLTRGLAEAEKSKPFEGKKVLVAEDNEINWEVAQQLFGMIGLDLDWAQNGSECVDKFKASELHHYDAVFMDMQMPVMNGVEAARKIRALASEREDANLPIIAMTANAFYDDIQNCLEAGMDAHVSKPIDLKEVIRLLTEYFGERRHT